MPVIGSANRLQFKTAIMFSGDLPVVRNGKNPALGRRNKWSATFGDDRYHCAGHGELSHNCHFCALSDHSNKKHVNIFVSI